MAEDPEKKCNPEEIVCQMQLLGYLKGMKTVLGDENFTSRFPELEGLDKKLASRIGEQDANVKEALERCGLLTAEKAEVEVGPEEE